MNKEAVIALLRELCSLVNYIAAGGRYELLSSGFNISKDISIPVVIEPAKNVIIRNGASSGEMDISVKGIKGHKGLVYEYALAAEQDVLPEDATWISRPSTFSHCTIINMPVGQRVLIRVGVTGPRNELVYTSPVLKMVA